MALRSRSTAATFLGRCFMKSGHVRMDAAPPDSPRMPASRRQLGFSTVELVIVCALMGILAASAIPRMSSAAETSRGIALKASLAQLQRCVDYYAAEHADRSPAVDPDGGGTTSGLVLAQRLMRRTDDVGTITGA